MYTLKGIFPEPKKEQKKNFIKENKKQLKYLQAKSPKDPPKFTLRSVHPPAKFTQPGLSGSSLSQVKSIPSQPSSKGTKNTGNIPKINSSNSRKKCPDVKIKKGDMAEFLKRREFRQSLGQPESTDDDAPDTPLPSHLRDMGSQTLESDLSLTFAKSTKLTTLYPRTDEDVDSKQKASGDAIQHQAPMPPVPTPQKAGDSDLLETEKRSRLNAILDRKDPYLPPGYQKGVVPKYLRERKEQELKEPETGAMTDCPAGHVALPDMERRETLRMLRSSFAELVSELNKMPVKTDTLRMRNRKMELEKQLAKLEEGIKVFSRPKVFVKIGE